MASSVQAQANVMCPINLTTPCRLLALSGAIALRLLVAGAPARADSTTFELSVLWPEDQREFLQDGPGLLLSAKQRNELLDSDAIGREQWIAAFLDRDPIPETSTNELRAGIAVRKRLALDEFLSLLDDRAKLLFLHGAPLRRDIIDCIEVYKPLEMWTYPLTTVGIDAPGEFTLVLYRPAATEPHRLWQPIDSKRVLYNTEMEYFLQQFHELSGRGLLRGRRFDLQICDQAETVDEITGVSGLFGFQPGRPKNAEVEAFLKAPKDLGAWAARAVRTPGDSQNHLEAARLELAFPERKGQRMESQFMVVIDDGGALGKTRTGEDTEEVRLTIEGHLELAGAIFESFRMRFLLPPPGEGVPVALVAPRRLRPDQVFLARLRVVDEISGADIHFSKGFQVPRVPTESADLPPVPEAAILALGDDLKRRRIAGYDSLIVVPPGTDIVFGLWRAEALVTGQNITKVVFFLDGQQVFKRGRPPFTAELRLPSFPVEQVVRIEGYDRNGKLLASDEVVLNQPRGQLRVRILEPPRGNQATGPVTARAEVVVPEERKVAQVTFQVNDTEAVVVTTPPWQAKIEAPQPGGPEQLGYLTVVAELDDGSVAESVRFLNAPDGLAEIDVNLVELYTTVTDRNGRLIRGLETDRFTILEDGREQALAKFELVEDLPLTLGIAIDTSGSMYESMLQAQRTAIGFLENIITPKDRAFALAFSDRPALLMPRTSDVGAVAQRIESVLASGSTSLHDAIVTSLYYFRGVRGRRALVVLSDGEDTSSAIGFTEALEYARRSGVSIFTIGLQIGKSEISIRRKLGNLAEQTGGRTFFISEASELATVYDEIENELRSQYLLAYNSDQAAEAGVFREVAVEVRDARGKRLEARTIRGYYQ